MSDRLPSDLLAKALMRRAFDRGGSATLLARGDANGGAILILALNRGHGPSFHERGIGASGAPALIRSGPVQVGDAEAEDYWRRRRARDPDLWVIELDIAGAERLAAETLGLD